MAHRRIFIASDIFIDVLLKREQFYKAGQRLLNIGQKEENPKICTSALVIANILYITDKALGKNEAK